MTPTASPRKNAFPCWGTRPGAAAPSDSIPLNAIAPGKADLARFCEEHRDEALQRLAPQARAIVEATSFATFIALADRFGGTEPYLPESWHHDSSITNMVSEADFAGLHAVLGAGRFAMPTLHSVRKMYRDHQMSELSARGLSRRVIASAFGVHVRTVGRVRQHD